MRSFSRAATGFGSASARTIGAVECCLYSARSFARGFSAIWLPLTNQSRKRSTKPRSVNNQV